MTSSLTHTILYTQGSDSVSVISSAANLRGVKPCVSTVFTIPSVDCVFSGFPSYILHATDLLTYKCQHLIKSLHVYSF